MPPINAKIILCRFFIDKTEPLLNISSFTLLQIPVQYNEQPTMETK